MERTIRTWKTVKCDEMMRVEKENGKRLMVGQVCRYKPNFAQAKQMVEAGTIKNDSRLCYIYSR